MECKLTTTEKTALKRSSGFTLVEALVAFGISGMVLAAIATVFLFSLRSFGALFNYADMDLIDRLAIDQLTRDIRQANQVTGYYKDSSTGYTNSLILQDSDGLSLVWTNNTTAKTLSRKKGNAAAKIMVKDCNNLQFTLGQRTVQKGQLETFSIADVPNAKVINVSWVCRRRLLNVFNTETVQTARIVIRKQLIDPNL
jgi:type II secretory pathway pseudopilin PulG